MTQTQLLLLPAFVHVALVMVIVGRMGLGRVRAVREGKVRVKDIALDSSKWPDDLRKLSNNYENQFQLPVFYYAVLALLLATALADGVAVALSWIFVATRLVHTLIHTGGNVVLRRFQAFLAGLVIIVLMWAWFGLRLYVIG